MKRVYKYPVEIADVQTILLPIGVQILSVQEQNGKAYLWAIVNPETIPNRGGRLVFHLFEEVL